MNDPLDERTEALIGKSLLGQASAEELTELEALSRSSSRVREALDLIERSKGDFRASSVGEELHMTAADLPDYYRPRLLAEALQRWFRSGIRLGTLAALVLTALLVVGALILKPDLPIAILGGGIGIAAVVVMTAAVVSTRRRQQGMGSEIEAGGDVWLKTVERVQLQERRYMSRTARNIMLASFAITPLLFVLSGVSTAPIDRVFAFASWATIATGVVIFQRRRMLRDLRGEV